MMCVEDRVKLLRHLIYIGTHSHPYPHVCMHKHTRTHTHRHTQTGTRKHSYMYASRHSHMHAHTNSLAQTHTWTHSHAHTFLQPWPCFVISPISRGVFPVTRLNLWHRHHRMTHLPFPPNYSSSSPSRQLINVESKQSLIAFSLPSAPFNSIHCHYENEPEQLRAQMLFHILTGRLLMSAVVFASAPSAEGFSRLITIHSLHIHPSISVTK